MCENLPKQALAAGGRSLGAVPLARVTGVALGCDCLGSGFCMIATGTDRGLLQDAVPNMIDALRDA